MYRKYRDSLFNIRYSYRGKKYREVPVHQCIVGGLFLSHIICMVFVLSVCLVSRSVRLVPSRSVSSRLVSSCPVPSRPVPFRSVSSCPVPSRSVSCYPVPFRPVLSRLVPSRSVSSCPVPFRLVLSRSVSFCPLPSRSVSSCPVPSRLVPSRCVSSRPIPPRPVSISREQRTKCRSRSENMRKVCLFCSHNNKIV